MLKIWDNTWMDFMHQELLDCEKRAFQDGAYSEGKVAKIMTK